MHQTILETWDDPDSITDVNDQKDFRHPAKGGMTTQHHNIKVSRPTDDTQKQQELN